MSSFPKRVFSGVQPSGELTLGNYLGAIERFVALQNSGDECLYCVVDLHAITVWQNPQDLQNATRHVTAAFIASGLDPSKSILFNQSQVSGHAELAWILNCVARIGWLNRMTQFKEKAGKNREHASVGLYTYPVLMAADILLYQGTHVPVGEDQKQHLELARDIAQKFNLDFAADILRVTGHENLFPIPEPLIMGPATRVMSLRDGTKKMSKSDPSDLSRITLRDDTDAICHKIRKAKTDPEPLPDHAGALEGRFEAKNLVGIYAALTNQSMDQVCQAFAGQNFGMFKPQLADVIVERLRPITTEVLRLESDPAYLDQVLSNGAQKAREMAQGTLHAVQNSVGFVSR